jgi:hypothetical protein
MNETTAVRITAKAGPTAAQETTGTSIEGKPKLVETPSEMLTIVGSGDASNNVYANNSMDESNSRAARNVGNTSSRREGNSRVARTINMEC